MPKIVNLTGETFGRLTVIERLVERPGKYLSPFWICICDCGNKTRVHMQCLRSGVIKSCGCLQKEAVKIANSKHGLCGTPEYSIWRNMKNRCYNSKTQHYDRYGGRGITVCDEWRDSFETFYRDMGDRPSSEHTLDRKDNDKGYSKENCRWATKQEQGNNKSNNVFYFYDGKARTLRAWCRELNLNFATVYNRIRNLGWSFEKAILK